MFDDDGVVEGYNHDHEDDAQFDDDSQPDSHDDSEFPDPIQSAKLDEKKILDGFRDFSDDFKINVEASGDFKFFDELDEDEIKKLDSQFSLYDSLSTKVPFGEPAFTCEEILAEIKKLKNNPYPRKILNIEKLITKFNASLPVSWGQK